MTLQELNKNPSHVFQAWTALRIFAWPLLEWNPRVKTWWNCVWQMSRPFELPCLQKLTQFAAPCPIFSSFWRSSHTSSFQAWGRHCLARSPWFLSFASSWPIPASALSALVTPNWSIIVQRVSITAPFVGFWDSSFSSPIYKPSSGWTFFPTTSSGRKTWLSKTLKDARQ